MGDRSDVNAGTVVVVGTGLLGRGIAGVAAKAGYPVIVHDRATHTLDAALAHVRTYAGPKADVHAVAALPQAVAGATFVIECVVEDLAVKQGLFAHMSTVAADAILMSNSSSFPIGDIAARAVGPDRTIGAHWFNPPQLIPMVEVIRGPHTSESTMRRTTAFLDALGKTTVRVDRDVPGFVGNRLQHALCREAVALLSDGLSTAHEIDRTVAATVGARLRNCGPLEEIDRLGATAAVAECQEVLPRIDHGSQPATLLRTKVAASELGAKTGRGFLVWAAGDRDRAASALDDHVRRCLAEGSRREVLGPFGEGLDSSTRFIARRLRMALWREAIALVADGVCDAETVDRMAQNTFGLRLEQMGPIETADFVGLDLVLAVHERIFPTFARSTEPPRLLIGMARAGTTFMKART